jgi:DUF4097 and DUF4098 domain-containing protein YvlB
MAMSAYAHRRGSIFWALTLIAIGVLFLYQNFNPGVHPWQIIAKYWPVLIIFWGVSKLMDYVHAQSHPETAPVSLFSGSEVVLLILILLLGTLVSKVVLHPWQQWPSAIRIDDGDFADLFLNSYSFNQTISQPVAAQPHLMIINRRGDVEAHAADSTSVDAVIKESIRADNEADARKLADQLKFSLAEEAGHYVLKSNLDSLPEGGRQVRLDLSLRVPKAASLELTTEHGDLLVDGLRGDQTLTSRHGEARVSDVEGLVRVKKSQGSTRVSQVKGSVEVEGRGDDVVVSGVTGNVTVNGDFTGRVQFSDVSQGVRFASSRTNLTVQKLSGNLDMEMGSLDANGIDGPIEISTRQKDINLQNFSHSVKISDTNGAIQLRAAGPPRQPIEVESKQGEIDLLLPAASSFQIQATSDHGEVQCDFSGPNLKVTQGGSMPSITGSYGQGGPTIRLSTSYGTIHVGQGGPQPSPHPSPHPSPTAGQNRQQVGQQTRPAKAIRAAASQIPAAVLPR